MKHYSRNTNRPTPAMSPQTFKNLDERDQTVWTQIVEEMRREWVPERQTD